MVRDVEVADAEREVHRVEIFERGRKVWKVKREEDQRENEDARLKGSRSIRLPEREAFSRAITQRDGFNRAIGLVHAGRRNSPSLRLPMR